MQYSDIQNWTIAALILAAVLVLTWMGSATVKGWIGEWWVKVYLRRLNPKVYHCLHNLLIQNAKGEWSQIDHVVVSRFGIFVIETKDYSGWIYGSKGRRNWTVTYNPRSKHTILSLVVQNAGHVLAVEHVLKLPPGRFQNVVFLGGDAEFKNAPIPGVVTGKLAKPSRDFKPRSLQPPTAPAWWQVCGRRRTPMIARPAGRTAPM